VAGTEGLQPAYKGGSVAYVLDDKGVFGNSITPGDGLNRFTSGFFDDTRHQPIIMQWSSKRQIAKAIYKENLVVVGREAPKYRRKRTEPPRQSHRQPAVIIASLVLAVAVIYTVVSISTGKPKQPLVNTAAVNKESGMAVAMINSAGQSRASRPGTHEGASFGSTAPVTDKVSAVNGSGAYNLTTTGVNAREARAEAVQDRHTIAMEDSLDHFFYDTPMHKPQDPLAFLDVDAYKVLANTETPLARLFGLSVRTIVIDPGHGGKDPGAIGQNGTDEKDIALAIALRLRDRLKQWENFKVYMTRDNDIYVPLRERVNFANEKHADLFVSIHTNSFPSENMNFIETYYFGPNSDSKVTRLAETENRDSDFVFAEFKEMLQNISDKMKFQESKKLAAAVQRTLYTNMRKLNAKAHNHGIKPAPFVVLLGLDAPSILTEVSNLSDKREEKRLNTVQYRDKIAKFLEKGIVSYLNKVTSDQDSTTVTKTGGRGNATEKEKLAQKETR